MMIASDFKMAPFIQLKTDELFGCGDFQVAFDSGRRGLVSGPGLRVLQNDAEIEIQLRYGEDIGGGGRDRLAFPIRFKTSATVS